MLAKIDDPELAAYVVWVPKNGAREEHVDRVLSLVTDPRASQYWDEYAAITQPYVEMFTLTGPCAGIFMIFDRDDIWEGENPPEPGYWEDAHARELKRDGVQFDAEQFADKVRSMID